MLVNAILLVSGFIGALAAIGGDTWHHNEKLLRRLTGRGWLAVACLIITLSFGLVKEVHTRNTAADLETNRNRLQEDLDSVQAQLTDSQNVLGYTARLLEETQKKLIDKSDEIIRLDAERKAALEKERLAAIERKKKEDKRYSAARKNIRWAVKNNKDAAKKYKKFRKSMTRYEAVLATQKHNKKSQMTIREYGLKRTTQYILELGK